MRPLLCTFLLTGSLMAQDDRPGYDDTPEIPGSEWRVHDKDRPRPEVVEPGNTSPASEPPADAVVLFAGGDLDAWQGPDGSEARWKVREDGSMEVNGTGDLRTAGAFGDVQLHLEWRTPAPPSGDGQGRGNSGVFLCDRYEVQILDSYDNITYADGQAAALYGQHPPEVNASRPPGQWQSYDIVFRAPRFEDGELVAPARITVFHNGVLVHHARELHGPTTHRTVRPYRPHGPAPIRLQDHGNPVRFRNIWVRRLDVAAAGG